MTLAGAPASVVDILAPAAPRRCHAFGTPHSLFFVRESKTLSRPVDAFERAEHPCAIKH